MPPQKLIDGIKRGRLGRIGQFELKHEKDVKDMIQCKDCEFYMKGPDGSRVFKCNPFENIVEPECLAKWQLMRLDMLLATQQSLYRNNEKLGPLQDKLIKYVEREIDDIDESDSWKYGEDDDYEIDEDEDDVFN
jgi:hypothetical protein